MDPALRNVMGFAIWGSLAATAVLGAFLFVQAMADPPRRRQFGVFSAAMGYLVFLDFVQSTSGWTQLTYEWLRLWWIAGYVGSALWLLEFRARTAIGVALGLLLVGFGSYYGIHPSIATTLSFPLGYAVVSAAHARKYFKGRGYASALLSSYSLALAILCAGYYSVVKTGNPRALILGYAHYAEACIAVVLFGWVHLPRELRGRSPVRTPLPVAGALGVSVIAAEIVVLVSLFRLPEGAPILYLGATVFQLGATLVVYFLHRHQLVIHADNVGQLLEDRTAALTRAREELARTNETQARLLAEQERDLRIKAEVIERQRRLELAAQTAGQAAHDIQNAIAPVLANLEDLERSSSAAEVRRIAVKTRQQVAHLLDLNGQMLALSRRGRGEFDPVPLNELIVEASQSFPGRPVRIELRDAAWVLGSWPQLFRTVTNLVANGLEAGGEGLRQVVVRCGILVTTEARRCHLGFLSPGRHACLQVEDDGPGIASEILDKVFEPFFSSKNGRQKSGSGLGLTIVSAVVDDHRGVLDLETRPGRTCFTLYFPAIDPPELGTDPAALSGNATVLVVEDDDGMRANTTAILEEAGYTVLSAAGGAQALQVLQLQEADLALLDLNMPGMTGAQTFMGAIHLRPNLQVLVHSSYLTPENRRELEAAGVVGFLQKPAGRIQLLKTLHRALHGRRNTLAGRS